MSNAADAAAPVDLAAKLCTPHVDCVQRQPTLTLEEAALATPANAHVLGITGPPAGKLIGQRFAAPIAAIFSVAVPQDLSSAVTGGALLGDRVRIDYRHFGNRVFFRSMASRGHQGALPLLPEPLSICSMPTSGP